MAPPLTRQDVFNTLTQKVLSARSTSTDKRSFIPTTAFKQDIDTTITQFLSLARDNLIACLTSLDPLAPQLNDPIEYEFAGPQPQISDISKRLDWMDLMVLQDKLLGDTDPAAELDDTELKESDQCFKCAICMEMYTDADLPVKFNACKHIVGQDCMATWLSANPTPNCPYCRTQLCESRAKVPKRNTLVGEEEQQFRILNFRLGSIVTQIHDVCRITLEMYPGSRKDRNLFDAFKFEVNKLLKEKKVGYLLSPRLEGFVHGMGAEIMDGASACDGFGVLGWRFQVLRVSWNLDGSLDALSEGFELVGASGGF
ncbi:hypothetical protein BDV96DRAFT_675381 [Lophiotrema nucula]|uniref:RING-type domain-containing protein n=1 Tax=Lophiotrema nucula TaxID=690887 RepID=A0A6A5YGJ6_9PLEO|nr:hypothetical protein BDV96DRAFT_675381 [Lophiotrema nucula]